MINWWLREAAHNIVILGQSQVKSQNPVSTLQYNFPKIHRLTEVNLEWDTQRF